MPVERYWPRYQAADRRHEAVGEDRAISTEAIGWSARSANISATRPDAELARFQGGIFGDAGLGLAQLRHHAGSSTRAR
jgi:hypothetical protein